MAVADVTEDGSPEQSPSPLFSFISYNMLTDEQMLERAGASLSPPPLAWMASKDTTF